MGHDEFDVLLLDALGVDLVLLVFLLLLGIISCGSSARLAVAVAGVVVVSALACKLLGGGSLGAGVQVLNLGLAEDAVSTISAEVPRNGCPRKAYI